jgi:hypothetical protein
MFRHPYRAPLCYFGLYLPLGFVAWYWPSIELALQEPPPMDFVGFYDPLIGPSVLEALLLAIPTGLVPAIGALAGVALASRSVTPPWKTAVLFALASLIPVVAAGCMFALFNDAVTFYPESPIFQSNDDPFLVAARVAFSALAVLWLLSPIFLTKSLYRGSFT